jgi:thioredoxin reductase (NADPH)
MTDVLILGDGPAGLSAALFLSKRGMAVTVVGADQTPMHRAMLYNYLGLPEMTGSEFQSIARSQVRSFGAQLVDALAQDVGRTEKGFEAVTEDGRVFEGRYLLLAGGAKRPFADALGLQMDEAGGIQADRDGRTSVDRLYAAGWSVRPKRVQAIISAGDGAAVALSILSREAGKDMYDFDRADG